MKYKDVIVAGENIVVGHRPEVYYHPDFEHLANAAAAKIEEDAVRAVSAFFGKGKRNENHENNI